MIGKQIKEERLARGITRYRMSKDSGVPIRTIIYIEEERVDPRYSSIEKLLNVLNCQLTISKKGVE